MLKIVKRGLVSVSIISLVLLVFCGIVFADFPEKPVTIIVGRGPGGAADRATRTFAPFFSRYLGVPVVVKNMKGAGGAIALREVWRRTPDGYTLTTVTVPSDLTKQVIRKPEYDLREFTYIQGVTGGDCEALVVSYDSEIKSLSDFLEASREGPTTFGSTAVYSNGWLLVLLLKQKAGLGEVAYVPFDSGAEALMAVIGGHVTVGSATSSNLPDPVRLKKIHVLAVSSSKRYEYLPNTPTFTELGYPIKVISGHILMATPGVSDDRKKVLADAAAKAVADPEFQELAKKQGISLEPLSPEGARKKVRDTIENISEALKSAGVIE